MNKEISTCKECKSEYYTDTSERKYFCPNCSYYLYGDNRCYHRFENGAHCTKCYWDGTVSERVTALITRNKKKLKSVNQNITIAIVILVISTPMLIIGLIAGGPLLLFSAYGGELVKVFFLLGVLGCIASLLLLANSKGYKKRLLKEIPYMD
ncbi:MAG: hypothetical protein AAF611_14195 [Bacteroidota bacterium]